jgi:hypothetical protein
VATAEKILMVGAVLGALASTFTGHWWIGGAAAVAAISVAAQRRGWML